MKKILSFGMFAVLSFLTIFGCKNELIDGSSSLNSNQSSVEYGSIVINDGSGDGARALDYSELTSATVSVICPDKTVVDGGTITLSNGSGSASINNIPAGKNRVVKVLSNVTGATLYGICDVSAGKSSSVTVNWDSTALGAVYYNLIQNGTNVSSFGDTEKAAIKAKIPSVHSSLVDAEQIAKDYPSMNGSYALECGTVEVTATGLNGGTVQVTDIVSSSVSVTGDSQVSSLNANPGTWKVKAVKGSETKTCDIKVVSGASTKVSITYGEAVTDKIVVKVPSSYGYVNMYVWDTSDSSINKTHISLTESDGYYTGTINVTASKIILTKKAGAWDSQTGDLTISEAGIWTYNGSSFDKTSGEGLTITVENPVVPELASVTLPSSSASLNGTFDVTVTSNCDVTSGSITINGTTKTLSNGKNTLNVADFASAAGTYSVSGSVTNKAGTTAISGSLTVVEKPALITDFNELRIYQVMVSAFQDGDSSIGYGCAYGPSGSTTGGDLQGIINAIPYIKALGCNALWMTPIFNSDGDSQLDSTGYFAKDYFNIDPKFGTMEKFDELVKKCHEEGIAVILDGVFGHNKGEVWASPTRTGINNPGITPSTSNPVDYKNNSNSIKYYSDVARYWITEHKIDGWRLDQCYQVAMGENAGGDGDKCLTGGHNYWYDIRKVVEEASAKNGTKGQDWGTLGYMVGEHWRGDVSTIQKGSIDPGTADGYGLRSCFDFPSYYPFIRAFAENHTANGGSDPYTGGTVYSALTELYKTAEAKKYTHPDGYYPNFMLSNHDLFRIGDLVNYRVKGHSNGDSSYFYDEDYMKRNEVILAAQAAYTGPITIYYGDEIGAHSAIGTSGWNNDNVARSSGKISGFSTIEQNIHDYEAKLLKVRSEHQALWGGTNAAYAGSGDFYVSKKTYGSETIYVAINYGTSANTFSASGTDLITGTTYSGTVTVPALSAIYLLEK